MLKHARFLVTMMIARMPQVVYQLELSQMIS